MNISSPCTVVPNTYNYSLDNTPNPCFRLPVFEHNAVDHVFPYTFNSLGDGSATGKNWSAATIKGLSFTQSGCLLGSQRKEADCTTACQNPALAWGDRSTLHNCMYYPAITRLLADGKLSEKDQRYLAQFGNFTSDIVTAIEVSISACAAQYCEKQGTCIQTGSWPAVNGTLDWQVPYFCRDDKDAVNPDICGIGVLYSYIIQLSISIFTCLWLSLYRREGIVRVVSSLFRLTALWRACRPKLRLWLFRRTSTAITSKGPGDESTPRNSSRRPPFLITALVDFQKAQCFFNAVTLIASIIALGKPVGESKSPQGQNIFSTISHSQLASNLAFVRGSAVGNLISLTSTLICLHEAGTSSSYLNFLGWLVVSLFVVRVGYWESRSEPELTKIEWASKCGGYDPSQHCHSSSATLSLEGIADNFILSVCMTGFAMVQLDQLATFCFKRFHASEDSCKSWLEKKVRMLGYWKWIQMKVSQHWWLKPISWVQLDDPHFTLRNLAGFFRLALDLAYLVSYYSYILFLSFFGWWANYFYWRPSTPGAYSWGWGQILAVTIWVPPVFEFINLFIYGMRRGSQYRLPVPYKVVNANQHASQVVGPENDITASSDEVPLLPLTSHSGNHNYGRTHTV